MIVKMVQVVLYLTHLPACVIVHQEFGEMLPNSV